MRRVIAPCLLLVVVLAVGVTPAFAQGPTYEVRITNLTRSQILSPPVIAAHDMSTRIFLPGHRASADLAALAEDAQNAGLVAALMADSAVAAVVEGDGPIAPGVTASFEITAPAANRLSIVSMLVTTNDAFLGVESFDLTSVRGRSDFYANAYDAGSERNTEDCDHIPGPPCGNGGVRVPGGSGNFIHIHGGMHGDGDLAASVWDWRNPVARIVVIQR